MKAAVSSPTIAEILEDETGQALIDFAKSKAAILAKQVDASQLRKIFYEVRGIEAEWGQQDRQAQALRRLLMLKPKLAYQTARHKGLRTLQEVLEPAIDYVAQHPQAFPRFVELFEAILAYFYVYKK